MSVVNNWNQRIIEEFRANDGRVGGRFAGNRLLLLHSIGAKSGQRRVNPLVTLEDDGRFIIVASKAGAPTHPDWYYNLKANPDVEVEYGVERFPARATVTEEPELEPWRLRVFPRTLFGGTGGEVLVWDEKGGAEG